MAASVELSETNGSGSGTRTDGISNINYGSADVVNLVPADHPLVIPTNSGQVRSSFGKFIQFHLIALNGSNKIANLRAYKSADKVNNRRQHEHGGLELVSHQLRWRLRELLEYHPHHRQHSHCRHGERQQRGPGSRRHLLGLFLLGHVLHERADGGGVRVKNDHDTVRRKLSREDSVPI